MKVGTYNKDKRFEDLRSKQGRMLYLSYVSNFKLSIKICFVYFFSNFNQILITSSTNFLEVYFRKLFFHISKKKKFNVCRTLEDTSVKFEISAQLNWCPSPINVIPQARKTLISTRGNIKVTKFIKNSFLQIYKTKHRFFKSWGDQNQFYENVLVCIGMYSMYWYLINHL